MATRGSFFDIGSLFGGKGLKRNVAPTKVAGTGGTAIYGGFVVNQEANLLLKDERKYSTYADILSNISIVAASVRFYLNLIAKAGWIVEPADESAEAVRIANIADAHYIPIAPHNVSSPLGMMAACHAMAAVPNFLLLEFHARDITWWSDLCEGDKPFIENGFMPVSDRPGLGVELNDDVAKTLLWNGDRYFD